MPVHSNTKIRKRLRKYARLFLERDCSYSEKERIAVQELLHRVSVVNPVNEELNKERAGVTKKINL